MYNKINKRNSIGFILLDLKDCCLLHDCPFIERNTFKNVRSNNKPHTNTNNSHGHDEF